MDYRQSGVDIDAGNETVRRIKQLARATFTPGVLSEIGSFGGLFKLDRDGFREPVLVASADGVGTKLKVAFLSNRHDTVGADLVNHCVNDILVQGARPLFFLDYLATGRLSPDVAEQVMPVSREGAVKTVARCSAAKPPRCRGSMPTANTTSRDSSSASSIATVSSMDREIAPGDVLIGLPSAGLHTNGYSLARRVFFETCGYRVGHSGGGAWRHSRRRPARPASVVPADRFTAPR